MLQREGFVRFPVVGLGSDPGLFLPVALSGKFYVCSTTDCSYCGNSAGSIQCTVKGSPPRIRVCIKENLCAARFEWYRSQPGSIYENKHLHVNWLLELWSLRNVARWFQILLNMSIWYSRYQSHRPVMILILPNISSIFVDVWVIGYLRNWFVDLVIGFWIVGLLISWLDSELLVCWFRHWILNCGLNVMIFI